MLKKVALIVITISIIIICLAFTLPVLSQVDDSTVAGTEYENTFNTVVNISGISFQVMPIFPLILIVGALLLVITGAFTIQKQKRSRGMKRKRSRGW